MRNACIAAVAAAVIVAPTLAEGYDISFKGGTAKEYYNALQEAIPDLRLVVHPDVDYFMMPAVELPDVSAGAAVWVPAALIDGVETELIPSEGNQTYIVTALRDAVARELGMPTGLYLDFEGGSLGTFVEAMRQEADANIVLDPSAAGVPLPPMRLRNADVHNVMMTIAGYQPEGFADDARLKVDWVGAGETTNYLYMVGLRSAADAVPRNTIVKYWSLGRVLNGTSLEAEDVLSAVEASRPFLLEDFDVSYHEATQVLIMKGAQSDLASIDNLLNRVEESAHTLGR